MSIEFLKRASGYPAKLGILPGAFNPPTRAHLELGTAALKEMDEVLFVLPRTLPHKQYDGVSFADRLDLLLAATAHEPRFSVGTCEGGLFVEIARECREAYSAPTDLVFLCGRDAAARIINWDYGDPSVLPHMLADFSMRVADRGGTYTPPQEFQHRIRALELSVPCDHISATEVRDRIQKGEAWEFLVPDRIVDRARQLYK